MGFFLRQIDLIMEVSAALSALLTCTDFLENSTQMVSIITMLTSLGANRYTPEINPLLISEELTPIYNEWVEHLEWLSTMSERMGTFYLNAETLRQIPELLQRDVTAFGETLCQGEIKQRFSRLCVSWLHAITSYTTRLSQDLPSDIIERRPQRIRRPSLRRSDRPLTPSSIGSSSPEWGLLNLPEDDPEA